MEVDYVTSNKKKFEEAKLILADAEWLSIVHASLHLDELQASVEEIASHKAREAFKILKKPVIIDDVSVHLHALNGLPGPYIRHFLETLGDDGIYTLVSHYTNRAVDAICTIAFFDGTDTPRLFQGKISGIIVEPTGTETLHGSKSWNRIVQPDGHDKTCAAMTLEEFARISHRSQALHKLRDYLYNEYYRT